MLMIDLENKISCFLAEYKNNKDEIVLYNIEKLFEDYSKIEPLNFDVLFKFAIFEYEFFHDDLKTLSILKKIVDQDKDNLHAILMMALISFTMSYAEKDYIYKKIEDLKTNNPDVLSLLEYAKALYWAGFDENLFKAHLEKSVNFSDKFVWNLFKLGRIYLEKGEIKKGKDLIKKAIDNIQYIYPSFEDGNFRIESKEEFLNERFKGIWLTQSNLNVMKNLLN